MLSFLFPLLATIASAQVESVPAPERLLTLREALALAVERNLAVERARTEIDAADATRRGALSAVLPQLFFGAALQRNSVQVSFGPPDDIKEILPLLNWNTSFSLSQPLFAGLRDLKAYQQTKLGIENAREGLRRAADSELLGVSQQFLFGLQAEALIAVEEQNLELAETRLRGALNFFEVGETTRVDVLRAETDIKAAERRVVEARRQREVAMSAIRLALALDEDIALVEPERDRTVPPLPDAQEMAKRALASRPEVRQAQYALESAQLEVEKQRGAYFPVVTADAGYVRQKTTFPAGSYGFAGVNVNVPIYQGGQVAAQVRLAQKRERQAELTLEEISRSVREDIRIAFVDLEATRTNLALAEEQLRTSEAEYQQTFELYTGQELTTLDVQASEAALADARRAVATGRLLVYAAEIEAWYAAGMLREVALASQESTP